MFGCDEGALTFLFHTGEVTDPAGPEYRVYQIPRHCGPEPICESFEEWLRWVHRGYNPAALDDEEAEVPEGVMPYARFPI